MLALISCGCFGELRLLSLPFTRNNDRTLRTHIYPDEVGERANQLLLAKIGERKTRHLIDGIESLPADIIQLFLSEIFSITSSLWCSQWYVSLSVLTSLGIHFVRT
jgi:hypothetical protein